MSDDTTQTPQTKPMQAKCKTCGHIWTPRNQESTKNRKCSKCGSSEIVMLQTPEPTPKPAAQPGTDPAEPPAPGIQDGEIDQEKLLEYINTKPEPQNPAAQPGTDPAEPPAPEKTSFKIHPALLAALLIIGLGIAAVFFLRRNRIRQNQRILQQTKDQEENPPQKIKRPVIGFYGNGGA